MVYATFCVQNIPIPLRENPLARLVIAHRSLTMATLKSSGARRVMTPPEAEELVKEWMEQLEEGAVVETLDLGRMIWPPEALQVLLPFIQNHVVPTIVTLRFDDAIASLETSVGLKTMQLLQVFGNAPHLKHVYLADNALGIRACELLEPILTLPLESLDFCNCGMSLEVCEVLLQSLQATQLEWLDLSRNQMGAPGASVVGAILQKCAGLRHLSYRGSRPLSDGTTALLQGLVESTQLEYLDLEDCHVADAELLQRVLEGNPLRHLNLNDCELPNVDCLLGLSPTLEHLELNTNELGAEGASTLAELLVKLPRLHTLVLEGNELQAEGAQTIVQACPASLRKLVLDSNEIEGVSIDWWTEHKLPDLQVLSLLDNEIDDADELTKLYPVVALDDNVDDLADLMKGLDL